MIEIVGYNEKIANLKAWQYYRKLIKENVLAFEIVYDNTQKNVVGVIELDASTLKSSYNADLKLVWTQYSEIPVYKRIFYAAQIIYISLSEYAVVKSDMSWSEYLNSKVGHNNPDLIKDLILNDVNKNITRKIIVPIGNNKKRWYEFWKKDEKKKAQEALAELILDYREEIIFDESLGTFSVNGNTQIPYQKEYWFPESVTN